MEFAHIYHWYLAFCQLFEVNYPVVNVEISDFTCCQGPPCAALVLVCEEARTHNDGEFSVDLVLFGDKAPVSAHKCSVHWRLHKDSLQNGRGLW